MPPTGHSDNDDDIQVLKVVTSLDSRHIPLVVKEEPKEESGESDDDDYDEESGPSDRPRKFFLTDIYPDYDDDAEHSFNQEDEEEDINFRSESQEVDVKREDAEMEYIDSMYQEDYGYSTEYGDSHGELSPKQEIQPVEEMTRSELEDCHSVGGQCHVLLRPEKRLSYSAVLHIMTSKVSLVNERPPPLPNFNHNGTQVYSVSKDIPDRDLRIDHLVPWNNKKESSSSQAVRSRTRGVGVLDGVFHLLPHNETEMAPYVLRSSEYTLLRCTRLTKQIYRLCQRGDRGTGFVNPLVVYSFDGQLPHPSTVCHGNATTNITPTLRLSSESKKKLTDAMRFAAPKKAMAVLTATEMVKKSQVAYLASTMEERFKEARGSKARIDVSEVLKSLEASGFIGETTLALPDEEGVADTTVRIVVGIPWALDYVSHEHPRQEDINQSRVLSHEFECLKTDEEKQKFLEKRGRVDGEMGGRYSYDWTFRKACLNLGILSYHLPNVRSSTGKCVSIPVSFVLSSRTRSEDVHHIAQYTNRLILKRNALARARCLVSDMESTFKEFLKFQLFEDAEHIYCAQHLGGTFTGDDSTKKTLFKVLFGSNTASQRVLGVIDIATSFEDLKRKTLAGFPVSSHNIITEWLEKKKDSLMKNYGILARLNAGFGANLVTSNTAETMHSCIVHFTGSRKANPSDFIRSFTKFNSDLWLDITSVFEGCSRNGMYETKGLAKSLDEWTKMNQLQKLQMYDVLRLRRLHEYRKLQEYAGHFPDELRDGRSYENYRSFLSEAAQHVCHQVDRTGHLFDVTDSSNKQCRVELTGITLKCSNTVCRPWIICSHMLSVISQHPSEKELVLEAVAVLRRETAEGREKRRRQWKQAEKKGKRRGNDDSARNFDRSVSAIVLPRFLREQSVPAKKQCSTPLCLVAGTSSPRPLSANRSDVLQAIDSSPSLGGCDAASSMLPRPLSANRSEESQSLVFSHVFDKRLPSTETLSRICAKDPPLFLRERPYMSDDRFFIFQRLEAQKLSTKPVEKCCACDCPLDVYGRLTNTCADLVIGHFEPYEYRNSQGTFQWSSLKHFKFTHPTPSCVVSRYPYFTQSMLRAPIHSPAFSDGHVDWLLRAFRVLYQDVRTDEVPSNVRQKK